MAYLLRCAPYFPVHDVDRTVGHYQRVFGFGVEYAAGEPAEFAIVSRDGLALMLRRVSREHRIVPNAEQGGAWDAFFWVKDADKLFDELCAHGADVVYPPTLQSYGTIEFAIRDVNGYVLGFGENPE